MSKQLSTSAKISQQFGKRILEQVIADGYGMKGKSKWVVEAIREFLKLDDYPELVDIADEMDNLNGVITFRLSEDLLVELETAVVKIRKIYPSLEGVKSNIIRASILQRLIRKFQVT
ncbi:MAG: hypothetical protein JSS53_06755 [Proteobacteria bacterium]|nr:hypothetical protein [Pseudomonadota bacterium]